MIAIVADLDSQRTRRRWSYWPLWVDALPAGLLYLTDAPGDSAVTVGVSANNRRALNALLSRVPRPDLAYLLPAHGFDLSAALAFGHLDQAGFQAAIEELGRLRPAGGLLRIPAALVDWLPPDLANTAWGIDPQPGSARATPWQAALLRLRIAFGLLVGHALISAVPLGLFGARVLGIGLGVIAACFLLLGLLWPWLPGHRGSSKGALVGVLLAGLSVALSWQQGAVVDSGLLAVALAAVGVVSGLVLSGSFR